MRRRSCCLLQRTELDSALDLKDGSVYTVGGEIADEAAALETLLNGDDTDNAVDGSLASGEP